MSKNSFKVLKKYIIEIKGTKGKKVANLEEPKLTQYTYSLSFGNIFIIVFFENGSMNLD